MIIENLTRSCQLLSHLTRGFLMMQRFGRLRAPSQYLFFERILINYIYLCIYIYLFIRLFIYLFIYCHFLSRCDTPTERRLKRWTLSIEELLSDPRGFQEFEIYLRKEYSHENILFWKAVQDLKKGSPSNIAQKVHAIFKWVILPMNYLYPPQNINPHRSIHYEQNDI